MKYLNLLAITLCTTSLIACEGSSAYRGTWKATDLGGAKMELTFDAKELSMKDETGKRVVFSYKQHSVKISNSIKSYGIKIGDGRTFFIVFPIPKDKTTALFEDGQHTPVYVLSRNGYKTYEDINGLK